MKKAKGNGLFDWQELRWEWHRYKLVGVFKWFRRELRFACQRVRQGYCDMDVWNLYDWFLDVVPDMLQQLREKGVGYPVTEGTNVSQSISPEVYSRIAKDDAPPSDDEKAAFDQGQAKWHYTLDMMIFLFHEADEERCERKNPYEDEYHQAYREFEAKYGMFGEKLRKPEDEDSVGHRVYFLHDVDEYRDIDEKYMEEALKIEKYRMECKDEAFQMFSKWFYALWD